MISNVNNVPSIYGISHLLSDILSVNQWENENMKLDNDV